MEKKTNGKLRGDNFTRNRKKDLLYSSVITNLTRLPFELYSLMSTLTLVQSNQTRKPKDKTSSQFYS